MVRAKPTFVAMAVLAGIGVGAVACLKRVGDGWPRELARPGLISRFQRANPAFRGPAAEGPRCAKDRLGGDFARAEVRRLEKLRTGPPLKGTWEKKDLAKLPTAAAQFLSAYGKWIATAGQDFSACEDVPCIINRVYGLGPAAAAGWKAYGWYLRTGYALSAKDYVPTGTRDEIDFGSLKLPAYLFSEAEIGNFWKLSFTLPESFKNMGALQTFHRVPSKFILPLWTQNTCADAWGNKNRGYIRMADRCLGATEEAASLDGFFFLGAPHEMAHRYDAWKGEGWGKNISDRAEWKAFSGWRSQTVVEDGKVKEEKWYPDPAKEGFVRDYAGTTPEEDWADTVAHVRYRPAKALQASPLKSAFISKLVYEGRAFDEAGLRGHYLQSMTQNVSSQMLELVTACLANPEAYPRGTDAEPLELEGAVARPLRDCLERGVRAKADEAAEALRAEEWEACDQLEGVQPDLRRQVASAVAGDARRYLAENSGRAPALEAGAKLRRALRETVDAREAYRHCFDHADLAACYDRALAEAFERAAAPYAAVLGGLLAEERNLFVGQNPLPQARARVEAFYAQFFAGIETSVAGAARERWQGCLNSPDPQAGLGMPLTQPFSGGAHFVSTSILNCVNLHAEGDLDRARDVFAARLGFPVTDDSLRHYSRTLLMPTYLEALRALEEPAARAEDEERERRRPGVIDVLAGQLQGGAEAFGAAPTTEGAVALCGPAAAKAFDEYFARVEAGDQLPTRFAAIEDLRTAWSAEACGRVVGLPKVQERVREQAGQAWAGAVSVLERSVAARARDRATDCIARHPAARGAAATRAVRDKRKQCLLQPAAWTAIETQALIDWEQSAEGKAFAARKGEAQKLMGERRKAWQADAINGMESR